MYHDRPGWGQGDSGGSGQLKTKVMNKSDLNKMKMYDQVVVIIEEHAAIWQNNVPFSTAYASFTQRVDGLKAALENQLALKGSHSHRKNRALRTLVAEAQRIEQMLRFFAVESENDALFETVQHTPSDWKRFKEANRVAICTNLGDELETHLSALAAYGLTQADLDNFRSLLEEYSALLTEPRTRIVLRSVITQGIRQTMTELDEILKLRLDNFVHTLKNTAPEFVQRYDAARNVIKRRSKSGGKPDNPESPVHAA
jgi:hypothetical protein